MSTIGAVGTRTDHELVQGALGQANILYRAGYKDVWTWSDSALLRAFQWLHDVVDFPAVGNDTWQPHLVNFYYDASFPAPVPSRPGKNVGFTDWTHGPGAHEPPTPPPASPPDPWAVIHHNPSPRNRATSTNSITSISMATARDNR